MKILVTANQKGGTGKSTVSAHWSFHLAENPGKKILAIDLDSQANLTDTLNPFACDVVASDLFGTAPITIDPVVGINLIAADPALADMERQPTQVVSNFVNNIRGLSEKFDYCVIDTAPSIGLRMTAALIVADCVLSPIELENYSIKGITLMLKTIMGIKQQYNPKLTFLGMLPNRVKGTSPRQKEALTNLLENYPQFVFNGRIGDRQAIPEALGDGIPVWELKKTSAREAAAEFKNVFALIDQKLMEMGA